MQASPAPPGWVTRAARRARGAIANASLALIASILTFVAAEAIIHLVGLAPPPGLFTASADEYERVPGIFGPSQSVIEGTGTRFAHPTRIDSLGYRGPDFPRLKDEGEFRILYVGDSFTYGHNVADHETLPAQLQRQLSTACGRVRVINAGLSGSTIDGQDAMALRGLSVAPDLVVLMYHENDIDEMMGSRIWWQIAENRRIKSRFPVSLLYRLLRHSAIWTLAQDARRSVVLQPSLGEGQAGDRQVSAEAVETAQREYGERLAALADSLRKVDLPFIFALFPHPESVRAGRGGRDYDRIRQSAVSIGLPTVDFLEAIQRSGTRVEDTFLVPEDYHPSALGYSIAAAELREVVLTLAGPKTCRAR